MQKLYLLSTSQECLKLLFSGEDSMPPSVKIKFLKEPEKFQNAENITSKNLIPAFDISSNDVSFIKKDIEIKIPNFKFDFFEWNGIFASDFAVSVLKSIGANFAYERIEIDSGANARFFPNYNEVIFLSYRPASDIFRNPMLNFMRSFINSDIIISKDDTWMANSFLKNIDFVADTPIFYDIYTSKLLLTEESKGALESEGLSGIDFIDVECVWESLPVSYRESVEAGLF
jgi:hypothetical protein